MESPFHEILERYLAIRGEDLHSTTVAHYRIHIRSFLEFLRFRHPEIDSLGKLKRSPHVEGWLESLAKREPPYTIGTRYQFLYRVRRFFRDLRKWGWAECPPPGLFFRPDIPRCWRNPSWARPRTPPRNRPNVPLDHFFPDTPFHRDLKRYLELRGATSRPSTLLQYRCMVLRFIEFLRRRFPELDSFAYLEREPHIERWLQELAMAQPPFTSEHRGKHIYNVRRFLDDIRAWGWPDGPRSDLFRRGDFPPPKRHLPKPLPHDVDVALMEGLRSEGSFLSIGLLLARRTGLRVGELCRLEMGCVTETPDGRYSLRVPLGKLRSERVIPIDPETAELVRTLRQLRGERPRTWDPESCRSVDAIFTNKKDGFLDRTSFYRKLKVIAHALEITDNVHPHRLRHTYATELLRNGLNLLAVMKLLGHTNLKMTLRYLEVTNEDLGRAYLRAMETARERYAALKNPPNGAEERSEPPRTLEATFDELLARIQAVRFDHPDPKVRKRLQRFVERLRRAQEEWPDALR
jgi:site-specific recombinase XerD